ncbi:MAG TPA: FkbM family methyltransferase [Solirubrobacteraceae bacterium]|nr:FkbM family methyltransferase [Solirubrobacteraceae bacterium]
MLIAVLLGLKGAIPRLHNVELPIRVAGKWFWLADVSELRVIDEIFVERIYDTSALPYRPSLILDLGSNAGAASLFFARLYPNARIVAYEADPRVAARAARNLRGLQVDVRTAAVSDSNDPIILRRAAGMSWGTGAYSDGEPFTVPGVTLDEIIGDQQIDVLKIDIEGSEHAAVKACARLSQVDLIIGEVHPIPEASAHDFFASLIGFDLIEGGGDERAGFVATARRDLTSTS